MIALGQEVHVDPTYVVSLRWVRGYHATCLVVRMHDGHEHHVPHQPNCLGGIDGYKIEKEILAAKEKK